jgi:hypothetical protein
MDANGVWTDVFVAFLRGKLPRVISITTTSPRDGSTATVAKNRQCCIRSEVPTLLCWLLSSHALNCTVGLKGKHHENSRPLLRLTNSPVLMAASAAKNPMAYMMLFFRSKRPGRKIHAVQGCTIKT